MTVLSTFFESLLNFLSNNMKKYYKIQGEKQCQSLNTFQMSFTSDFVLSFQTVFLTVESLTLLFSLTVPNFVVFFRLLDAKYNKDSKNVLQTVILSLQVSCTSDFVPDCPFKLCFWQFKL